METTTFTVRFLNQRRQWKVLKTFTSEIEALVHIDRKIETLGGQGFLLAIFQGRSKLWDTRNLAERYA